MTYRPAPGSTGVTKVHSTLGAKVPMSVHTAGHRAKNRSIFRSFLNYIPRDIDFFPVGLIENKNSSFYTSSNIYLNKRFYF